MKLWLLIVSAVCAPALAADLQVPTDFPKVQEAVDAAQPGDRILIAPGIYLEQVRVSTPRLQLVGMGEAPVDTVIQSERSHFGLDSSGERWGHRSLALDARADIEVRNLTIENAFDEPAARAAGLLGASRAARFLGAVVASDVVFLGWKDTLQVEGDGLFERVEIQGSNDYVYGRGSAVFRDSRFYSRGQGTVVAHASAHETRFVFENCRFEAAAGVEWWLARPWSGALKRGGEQASSTVRIRDSYLGSGVGAGAFRSKDVPPSRLFFHECGNYGPGAAVERVSWARRCD